MMNFDALTRCFEHEIFEHGCHSVFFEHEYSDNTNIFLAHGSHRSHGSLFAAGRSQFLEHEIRRRTTDRREVITRITRILFAHGSHGSLFAAGAHMGNTRFLNTDVTLSFFEHEIRRRPTDRREVITQITRILFAHGSHSHFSSHSIFCKKALGM